MKSFAFVVALPIFAIHAEVPNTFKPNDPARATEVNQNFKYLDSAVATKANKAPLDLAIDVINTKASKTDLDNKLDAGAFNTFQKKIATDSSMLEGKIKASASATQVKTDLDLIRADVATKAAAADLKTTQADLAKVSASVGNLATSTELAKLKDAVGAKADTNALKTTQGDVASLKTTVAGKASSADMTKTQSELASMAKSVGAKADTGTLISAQGDIASLKKSLSTKAEVGELAQYAKHATMEQADASFDKPPYASSFSTILSATGAPFSKSAITWYNLISLRHRNGFGDGDVYGGQIAWGMTGFQGRLAFRSQAGAWSDWTEVLTKASITAADLPGGPYIKESTALSVDTAGVVHMAALKLHSDVQTPDYVFAPDYKLAPLAEVEAYTQQNQHLPDVPSASEIEKGGMDLAKMNLALLRKVEELTLHAIAQEKRIRSLEAEVHSKP